MKKIYTFISLAILPAFLIACSDFLDELPDNRATLDTEEKMEALLVSAYPDHDFQQITEMMSDNVDDMDESSPYSTRYAEQLFYWEDITETDNESPENVWEAFYIAIASANEVLLAIEDQGGATTSTLQAIQAEALLCRAYCHFILVNVFALNYNTETSDTDPGVTYMTKAETTLLNDYERNSVAECYELIAADIEAALPYVSDSYYSVPKYHFNTSAAYAFASKFYLFYEQWDKCIEYADKVLGTSPTSVLRDYEGLAENTSSAAQSQAYIDATMSANLLLTTGYSKMGLIFGPYTTWKRFVHNPYLTTSETTATSYPFGTLSTSNVYARTHSYPITGSSFVIYWRLPYLFEYTDEVAGIGYYRCVFNNLSTDETLLNRAEAKIMLGEYDSAVEDMNMWVQNFTSITDDMTVDDIVSFYNGIEYATWDAGTVKKHLNPAFTIDAEGSTQECLLQCVLGIRRIETMHLGMRWFDIKRYGIEIWRRVMNSSGTPDKEADVLTVDDPRRAVQIPQKVISAGYEANPR